MTINTLAANVEIKDHWLWQDGKEFSRFQAWLDLVVSASKNSEENLLYCHPVTSRKRGQAVTSIKTLTKEWKWSRGRVVRFLDLLEKAGSVKVTKTGKMLVLDILETGCGLEL